MSTKYQIVGADGQVSRPLDENAVSIALSAGRLLGSDLIRLSDGAVQELLSISEFSEAVMKCRRLDESVDTVGLAQHLGRIATEGATGHLVLSWDEYQSQQVWSFVGGRLVVVRPMPTDQAPIQGLGERQMSGVTAGKAIVDAFGRTTLMARFVSDSNYSPKSPQVHLTVTGVIETGLWSSMTPTEMSDILASLGEIAKGTALASSALQMDRIDRQIVRGSVQYGADSRAVEALRGALDLAKEEVLVRLMKLYVTGVLVSRGVGLSSLKEAESNLGQQDLYERLNVSNMAGEEAIHAAFAARAKEFGLDEQAEDTADLRRLRSAVRRLLEEARDTLSDKALSSVYRRAHQTGVDFKDPAVRDPMLREYYLTQGKLLLDGRQYDEAVELLESAVTRSPREARAHILLGWAQFLSSDESEAAANTALSRVRQALDIDPNSEEAYLAMGKICRLAGRVDDARRYLTKVTSINKENNEAWAQLRLVNTKKVSSGLNIDLTVGHGLGATLGTAALVLILLYSGANLMQGGLKMWPMLADGSQQLSAVDKNSPKWLKAVEAKRVEGKTFDVPKAKQVLGNGESFILVDDQWYWARRGFLLFMGLLGIFVIARERFTNLEVLGKNSGWLFLGLFYGAVIGLLSPLPMTPTPMYTAMGMVTFQVIAEQMFFFAFIGWALIDRMDSPLIAIALTAMIFGLHQFTFFATLSLPPSVMLRGILQYTAFAGGAYAFLLWRTGGILAPMLTNLVVALVMVARSIQAYGG